MQNSTAIFCFSPVYLFVEEEYLLFVEKDKKLLSYFLPRLFLLLLHSLVRISVPCLAFLSNQSHCPELVNLSYFFIKPITHPMANQSTNSFSKQPISSSRLLLFLSEESEKVSLFQCFNIHVCSGPCSWIIRNTEPEP